MKSGHPRTNNKWKFFSFRFEIPASSSYIRKRMYRRKFLLNNVFILINLLLYCLKYMEWRYWSIFGYISHITGHEVFSLYNCYRNAVFWFFLQNFFLGLNFKEMKSENTDFRLFSVKWMSTFILGSVLDIYLTYHIVHHLNKIT